MTDKINKYKKTFCIGGNSKELLKVREFVGNLAKNFGFNEIETNKIVLAVDEVCSNLIKHPIDNIKSRKICIEIITNKPDFLILITDDTPSFDLTKSKKIDMNEYFKNYQKGGLGIQIIKNVMDEIKYFPSTKNNPKNTLYLRKQL